MKKQKTTKGKSSAQGLFDQETPPTMPFVPPPQVSVEDKQFVKVDDIAGIGEKEEKRVKKVRLRDHSYLYEGDIVTTNWKAEFVGKKFVVKKLTEWETCESGMMLIAECLEDPTIRIVGVTSKGVDGSDVGIDANHFTKVQE